MPPRAQRNFRLRKDLSVWVIKAWLELLRLEDGVLTWSYWDTDERIISEILGRYNTKSHISSFVFGLINVDDINSLNHFISQN